MFPQLKMCTFADKMCIGKACFNEKKREPILGGCGGYLCILKKRTVSLLKCLSRDVPEMFSWEN